MAIRKHPFEIGQYYHVYNRGVDKRDVIMEEYDLDRFMLSVIEFNTVNPIGSIFENKFKKSKNKKNQNPHLETGCPSGQGDNDASYRLVDVVAYCVNPNHYHFLLTPLVDKGIERFMQRLGVGYTKYFNEKYKRSGVLFQGRFKSKHIDSDGYLMHVSAYINMNNRDSLGHPVSKLSASSFWEYVGFVPGEKYGKFCSKKVILDQIGDSGQYLEFSRKAWAETLIRKTIEEGFEL